MFAACKLFRVDVLPRACNRRVRVSVHPVRRQCVRGRRHGRRRVVNYIFASPTVYPDKCRGRIRAEIECHRRRMMREILGKYNRNVLFDYLRVCVYIMREKPPRRHRGNTPEQPPDDSESRGGKEITMPEAYAYPYVVYNVRP
jgi:hypothetical protein